MKKVDCLIGVVFSAALFAGVTSVTYGSTSQVQSKASPTSHRIYCNVYTVTACFNVGQGDTLAMSIPVDFVLYDLRLSSSVTARIYLGYNPDKSIFESATSCRTHGKASRCRYVRSGKVLDILYDGGRQNQPFLHVHVVEDGVNSAKTVREFLGDFRPCAPTDNGVACTDERIFDQID